MQPNSDGVTLFTSTCIYSILTLNSKLSGALNRSANRPQDWIINAVNIKLDHDLASLSLRSPATDTLQNRKIPSFSNPESTDLYKNGFRTQSQRPNQQHHNHHSSNHNRFPNQTLLALPPLHRLRPNSPSNPDLPSHQPSPHSRHNHKPHHSRPRQNSPPHH